MKGPYCCDSEIKAIQEEYKEFKISDRSIKVSQLHEELEGGSCSDAGGEFKEKKIHKHEKKEVESDSLAGSGEDNDHNNDDTHGFNISGCRRI